MSLNDPLFVAHSGFVLNKRGNIDPLALATVGFIRELDITTARFCLYVLLKRDKPSLVCLVRDKSVIEVRKRNSLLIDLYYRKALIVDTNYRDKLAVLTKTRKKANILVYINNCE